MQELLPVRQRGRFLVIYGPNNIGKSTQIGNIARLLIGDSHYRGQLLKVKYPIYGLRPTGPEINRILRQETGMAIPEVKLQTLFAQNRRDFQELLITLLNTGITVLAEDYTGTGLAWGLTRGVPLKILLELNADLIDPDIAILLDGNRFLDACEPTHRNEGAGDEIWSKNRVAHLHLADMFGWQVIDASQEKEAVTMAIWEILQPILIEP